MNSFTLVMYCVVAVGGGIAWAAAIGVFDRTASPEWIRTQMDSLPNEHLRALIIRQMREGDPTTVFTRSDIKRIIRKASVEERAVVTAAEQLAAASDPR